MATQRSTMSWDKMVEMALETWHPGDDPFLHVLTGLAGEAGEMIDQYKKYLYKDGYECSREKFLNELGDFWYYLRIASHLKGVNLMSDYRSVLLCHPVLYILIRILAYSSRMLEDYHIFEMNIHQERFYTLCHCMSSRLDQLNCTIEELTQLNYDKLSDNKHGW